MNAPLSPTPIPRGSHDHRPGEVLGSRYRLVRKLGEGAMGAVWVAEQVDLDRKVAVKLLRTENRDPVQAARLLREARALASLDDADVVRVFEFGCSQDGTPYIVMEMLEGEDLRDVLQREGRLSEQYAVALMLPIASALHAAHELGIIHRDLKPENIVLAAGRGGTTRPTLVDFGIAKLARERHRGTISNGPVGTVEYMPPEQLLCLDVDRRADVWAFASVLYELLSGRTPFPAEGVVQSLCAMVHEQAIPLTEYGIDAELSEIVHRGLEKEPRARWPTLGALGEALAQWLVSRGVHEDVRGMSLRASWGVDSPTPAADPARHTPTPEASPDLERTGAFPLVRATQRPRARTATAARKRSHGAFVISSLLAATLAGAAGLLVSSEPLARSMRAGVGGALGVSPALIEEPARQFSALRARIGVGRDDMTRAGEVIR